MGKRSRLDFVPRLGGLQRHSVQPGFVVAIVIILSSQLEKHQHVPSFRIPVTSHRIDRDDSLACDAQHLVCKPSDCGRGRKLFNAPANSGIPSPVRGPRRWKCLEGSFRTLVDEFRLAQSRQIAPGRLGVEASSEAGPSKLQQKIHSQSRLGRPLARESPL